MELPFIARAQDSLLASKAPHIHPIFLQIGIAKCSLSASALVNIPASRKVIDIARGISNADSW